MSIKKEIDRAVKLTAALNGNTTPKTPAEQDQIVLTVEEAVRNSAFNFNNATSAVLSQDGKKRLVKRYTDLYSPEHILCQCIKQILDRTFKVRYPNRNKISHDLFATLTATIQMADFTIVKFDFKDYFNSISSIAVLVKKYPDDRRTIVSFLLSTLLNNISKKKSGYTLFGKKRLGKALLLLDIALYIYAFYPSFDQTRKVISIVAYLNSEVDFKHEEKAKEKLSNTINRYSFIFQSGNIHDLCDWMPFFHEYNIELDTTTECALIENASKNNDPIIWANLLLYSQYYKPFFMELLGKIEAVVTKQLSKISDKDPMMQEEFWYVLIFHNCPYISVTLRTKMSSLIQDIRLRAANKNSNPSNRVIQLICDFLERSSSSGNKPEESLFNWKGVRNFSDQITYRTYQRTVFKRYRKNTYGLYASID